MNPQRAFSFPGWEIITQELVKLCTTPAGQRRAQHLQPVFSRRELEDLQRQTREMNILLSHLPQPLESLRQSSVQTLLLHLEAPVAPLAPALFQAWQQFSVCLQTLRTQVQPLSNQTPLLWQWLKPLKPPEELLRLNDSSLPQEKRQRCWSRRWRDVQALVRGLAELDLLQARGRLGQHWHGALAHFSYNQEIQLPQWRLPLDLLQKRPCAQGELHWPSHCNTWLLSGRHGSGKTRLLQNLGLTVLVHQAGIAIPSSAEARLPVFSSVHYLAEDLPLEQQLRALQGMLKRSTTHQLLLLDNPLTHSNPSESTSLLRSLIQTLAGSTGKILMVTHNKRLGQLAQELPSVETRALITQGSNWHLQAHQQADSELLALARRSGWPAELLKQAEISLEPLKHPTATSNRQAVQPPAAPDPPQRVERPIHSQRLILTPGVKPGVWIYFEPYNAYGELLSLPDNKGAVWIQLDNKRYQVDARHVLLSSHRKEKKGDTTGICIVTQSVPADSCDLHGLRIHEALSVLEKFLDTASHAGLLQVTINHGKGGGTLRQAVHNYLRNSRYVRGFRLADYGRGDSGVTQVELS